MNRHLERICIERYGAARDREIGPFASGLNVVFGPNEAGKSTAASFVGGVLFGWEGAHGVTNTYSPEEGDRAGSLVFSDGARLSREGDGEVCRGDVQVVSDIDAATFKTMFSLTSDELRALRNSSDVAARLLTAGSGTASSPAGAFVEIEQRIALLTSRDSGAKTSIFNLSDDLDEQREDVKQLGAQVELRKSENRELRALREDRAIAARHLSDVNHVLDELSACRTRLALLDERRVEALRELVAAESDRAACEEGPVSASFDVRLMKLDNAGERSLRDKLDEYADDQAKATRGLDIAKENAAASAAAYEALVEMESESGRAGRPRRSKTSLAALPAALAVAFTVAGIPTFVHARSINSLSLTALGIGLVLFACLLAIMAVALVARPDRSAEALDARQQDAQWVMLQDRKKLESSAAAKRLLDAEISAFLDDAGLATANGSIRQARALLDDAREARSQEQGRAQRLAAIDLRLAAARRAAEDLAAERRGVAVSAGFDESVMVEEIESEIVVKTEQREALAKTCDDMGMRMGELAERLERAKVDREFDRAKLRYEQTRVRLRDAKRDLVTLLLAKNMVEKSIVAWESRSQPGVYRKASELFSLITCGAWCQVSMTAEGRLVATASDGTAREVRHLSLGTCQQLYLSLRVAMLLHAENVGRCVPVLADDILVNFDAQRRLGAARVLAELAEKRQVIVFTCHRETVEALRVAAPHLNFLEL